MMFRPWPALAEVLRDDSGATLVEYALVMTLFSVVGIEGLALMGTNTGNALANQALDLQTMQMLP